MLLSIISSYAFLHRLHPASEQAGRVWCEVCTAEVGSISLQRDTVTVGVTGHSVMSTIACCHPLMTWSCSFVFKFGGTVVWIYCVPLVSCGRPDSCLHFHITSWHLSLPNDDDLVEMEAGIGAEMRD